MIVIVFSNSPIVFLYFLTQNEARIQEKGTITYIKIQAHFERQTAL